MLFHSQKSKKTKHFALLLQRQNCVHKVDEHNSDHEEHNKHFPIIRDVAVASDISHTNSTELTQHTFLKNTHYAIVFSIVIHLPFIYIIKQNVPITAESKPLNKLNVYTIQKVIAKPQAVVTKPINPQTIEANDTSTAPQSTFNNSIVSKGNEPASAFTRDQKYKIHTHKEKTKAGNDVLKSLTNDEVVFVSQQNTIAQEALDNTNSTLTQTPEYLFNDNTKEDIDRLFDNAKSLRLRDAQKWVQQSAATTAFNDHKEIITKREIVSPPSTILSNKEKVMLSIQINLDCSTSTQKALGKMLGVVTGALHGTSFGNGPINCKDNYEIHSFIDKRLEDSGAKSKRTR